MALAGNAIGGIGAAQRHMLIERHIVADFRCLADHGEAMIDEEITTDLRAGVDVVAGQKRDRWLTARARKKSRALYSACAMRCQKVPDAGIEENFHAQARRGVARLDQIQIANQSTQHGFNPCCRIAL